MKCFLAALRGLPAPLQTSILAVFFSSFLALLSRGHRSEVFFGLPEGAPRPPSDLHFGCVLFFFFGSAVKGSQE